MKKLINLMCIMYVAMFVILMVLVTTDSPAQLLDGDKCVKGSCENGYGKAFFANGDKYIGQWKDGVFHGKGIYTSSDGSRYEGQYLEGTKEGTGTYTYSNGLKYIGSWSNGSREGFGTLFKGKKIVYQGYWSDDRMILP